MPPDVRVQTAHDVATIAVGEPIARLNGTVRFVPYDPEWPRVFEREAVRIRASLGDRVRLLEHAGSTSVPGLAAKPQIDIVLAVPDSSDEAAYVPDLEAAGYVLRIREPEWWQHRLFNRADTKLNLHVFTDGSPEIRKMLTFRDWLRAHDDDRELYERTKFDLGARTWTYMQDYADAKSSVVEEILARAGWVPVTASGRGE